MSPRLTPCSIRFHHYSQRNCLIRCTASSLVQSWVLVHLVRLHQLSRTTKGHMGRTGLMVLMSPINPPLCVIRATYITLRPAGATHNTHIWDEATIMPSLALLDSRHSHISLINHFIKTLVPSAWNTLPLLKDLT